MFPYLRIIFYIIIRTLKPTHLWWNLFLLHSAYEFPQCRVEMILYRVVSPTQKGLEVEYISQFQ
jgi:hypothetical protein